MFFFTSDNFKKYLIRPLPYIFSYGLFFLYAQFCLPFFHPYPTFTKTTASRQPQVNFFRSFKLSLQKLSDVIEVIAQDIDPVFKLSHNQNKHKSASNKNIDILGVKMRKIYQVQRCEFDLAGGLKSLADLTCEFGEGKVSKLLISLHALPLT